jgi:hypothetical protein
VDLRPPRDLQYVFPEQGKRLADETGAFCYRECSVYKRLGIYTVFDDLVRAGLAAVRNRDNGDIVVQCVSLCRSFTQINYRLLENGTAEFSRGSDSLSGVSNIETCHGNEAALATLNVHIPDMVCMFHSICAEPAC